MKTVYITIGNSDDRLPQERWAQFTRGVAAHVRDLAQEVHGQFFSNPDSQWQNACWAFEIVEADIEVLKANLREVAHAFDQTSIGWAEVPEVEFLTSRQHLAFVYSGWDDIPWVEGCEKCEEIRKMGDPKKNIGKVTDHWQQAWVKESR